MNPNLPRFILLIAEDDPEDRILIEKSFASAKSIDQLRYVGNGQELLDYLDGKGGYEDRERSPMPSIIVLDLNMPVKNGREVLSELKSNPRYRSIPVIILTSSDSSQDVNICYDMGANTYVVKSPSLSELTQAANRIEEFWFRTATLPATISEHTHES